MAVLTRLLTLLPVVALLTWSGSAAARTDYDVHAPSLAKQVAFRADMGALWDDHVGWTRLFIISALADAPDLPATTERLQRSQEEIGSATKPFYGDAAGEQLTALLTDHILIAADAVAAAQMGDTERLAAATSSWEANADDIAGFLAAANPEYWPYGVVQPMVREHLTLTTAELVARLTEDWDADVVAYDRVHQHAVMMSDLLSQGLFAAFPTHFE